MLDQIEKQEVPPAEQFNILLEGYEGPIDLLLDLAKKQKVDLSDISILKLSEQYLVYINKYTKIHLEIAADYLVMAAWLTYLKSRLLLPKDDQEEEYTSEELELALKYQLQRLEAMQKISKILMKRPLIDRDTFYGGTTEGIITKYDISYSSTLFDLLKTYTNIVAQPDFDNLLKIDLSDLYSVDEAIVRLKEIFLNLNDWTNLMNLIPKFGVNKIINKSSVSSNFVASLELVKNGFIEVKQDKSFDEIYVRSKN